MSEQKKRNLKDDLVVLFSNKKQDEKWVEELKSLLRSYYDL